MGEVVLVPRQGRVEQDAECPRVMEPEPRRGPSGEGGVEDEHGGAPLEPQRKNLGFPGAEIGDKRQDRRALRSSVGDPRERGQFRKADADPAPVVDFPDDGSGSGHRLAEASEEVEPSELVKV